MLTDRANTYSISQALTVTAVSTDVIDHQAAGDLGRAHDARVIVQVPVAFAGGTSIDAQIQTSDVENFGSGVVVLNSSGAIPLASLTAGAVILDVPIASNTRRYTRINYVIVGTMTAGAVDAHFVLNSPSYRTFPNRQPVF
jgi:hypothetical protein